MAETFDPTRLIALDYRITEAWKIAATELGITVIAPFDLPVGQRVFRYGALVVGFGTPKGVLLKAMLEQFHPDECGAIWAEADKVGYTNAQLSPMLCHFDRDEFITFLNFFGWCGAPDERPKWHDGPMKFDP